MSAINPNHPVTDMMRDQWHKIVAFLMNRYGIDRFDVQLDDIAGCEGKAVVAHSTKDGLKILLMDESEAVSMAVKRGDIQQ